MCPHTHDSGQTEFQDLLRKHLVAYLYASTDAALDHRVQMLPADERPYNRGSAPLLFWLRMYLRLMEVRSIRDVDGAVVG